VLTDKSTYEALYNFLKFPPDSLLSQPLLLKTVLEADVQHKTGQGQY